MSIDPGTQIGRFRVVRLLAQGGMAEVYRADQELAGGIFRPVALKVIRPEYSESQDFREMFLDEARTACTLSHPNIVHIYEVGEDEGRLYMAMELVPGETLATVARALRDQKQRLPDDALLAVGIYTCAALEAVHLLRTPEGLQNLVHRDVSPHNLLLGPTGSLKLIDFGIAKAAHNRNLTSVGVTKGKAGYFSPEQAMGHALDGRSDLFSLGVTLYKLAYGATPFDDYHTHVERNSALVAGKWQKLEKVCPGLPDGFYQVVDRSMQLSREDRYPDAASMRQALEQVALEIGVSTGPSSLAGFVEPAEPSGPTSTSTANRMTAQAPRSRPRTEQLRKPQVPAKGKRLLVPLALAASVLVGAGGAVGAYLFAKPRPAPPPPQAIASPPPPAAPAPPTDPKPKPPAEPDPRLAAMEFKEIDLSEKPRPARVRTHAVERSKPKTVAMAEPPKEAPVQVPQGQGRLRIGAVPDGEVTVSGKKWGVTPLNKELPSGVYTVEIQKLGGTEKGSCKVTVWPDKTARVRYQFDDGHCTVDN